MTALTKTLAATASAASLMLVLGMTAPLRAEDQGAAPAREIVLPPLPSVQGEVPAAQDAPGTPEAPAAPTPGVAAAPQAGPAAAPLSSEASPDAAPAAETAQVKQAPSDTEAIAAALKSALEKLAAEPAKTAAARREREALVDFYVARNDAPIWRQAGAWSPAAASALERLEHADEDALDLRSTPLPVLRDGTPEDMATVELALSAAVANYGRQASGSRIDPLSISRLITEKPEIPDVARILTEVSAAADAQAVLQGYNPDREAYRRLRAKLAELRREQTNPAAMRIDAGPVLKVGMKDPRVPLIRAHFRIGAQATTSDDLVYDTRVASAVRNFQRANGLPPSGQLTARTVAVLSGGHPARLEAEIIANMERLRWLPHEAAPDRIEVNIPDYTVRVFHNDAIIHQARVIVGKPTTPTPIFSNEMKFLEVNPYWNVPDSIIKKEMLPKLAADPTYLTRMGYEVKTVRGRLVVRQPPGERNALGNIKFMFPNQHAVYLHDTPTRSLFKTERRAYSHGCVRVDDPFKLAEIVLGKDHGWSEARVKSLVGKGNRTIHLPKPLDIDIAYFTAFVDDAGKLQLRDDIYGYSHKVIAALGLDG